MKKNQLRTHANALFTMSIFFSLFFLMSCDKEEEPLATPESENTEALFQYLESTGFDRESIVLEDETFIIDDDILISKEEVEKYASQAPRTLPEGRTDHYRGSYLVNDYYVTNIKVYIESSVPSSWRTATLNAINQWNAVSGTKLYFTSVSNRGSADIRVNTSYSTQNWVARAYLPSYYGRPGNLMTINTRFNYLDSGLKLFTMVHEMGHTFGFYHTDQTQGIFIQGTPYRDDNSVMNSYILPWNGFTTGDITAVRILYPE